MTAHDPLCPWDGKRTTPDCICRPLRQARADERERIEREIVALPRPWVELTDQYRRGWDAAFGHALRIARGER